MDFILQTNSKHMSAAEHFSPCILIKEQTSSFRVKLFSLVYCTTLVNNCKCGHFLLNSYANWHKYILVLEGGWGEHALFTVNISHCADQHLKNIEVNNDKIWLKTWLSKQCFFWIFNLPIFLTVWVMRRFVPQKSLFSCSLQKRAFKAVGGEFIKLDLFRDLFDHVK